MQHTYNGENAARDAWASFTTKFPRVYAVLSIVGSFLGFFVNGHFMVWLAQWLVRVAGRGAQSALLVATLYVTINNVARPFVVLLLPGSVISVLNQLSVIAFSIIPELIVASAIQATYEHWALFFRSATWKNGAWVWAVLYTLPTLAFVVITYITLSSFVDTVATSGVAPMATGVTLTIRFLAGWSYCLVEILFVAIGKRGYVAMVDNLRAIATELRATIALRDTAITELTAQVTDGKNSLAALQVAHDAKLNALQVAHDTEIKELQVAIEKATRSRSLRRSMTLVADSAMQDSTHSATIVDSDSTDSATYNGNNSATRSDRHSATDDYVAIDNGESIAVTDSYGATVIATGEPRDRIKQAILVALQSNEKINYKEIAETAQAGYSTVRKHAPTIIEEISQEMPAISLTQEV